MSNFDILIEEARSLKYISESDFDIIKDWKSDPENWHKKLNYSI